MADPNQNSRQQLDAARQQIRELDTEIKRLGGEGFKNVEEFIRNLGPDLDTANKQVKLMRGEVTELKNAFSNISTALKNILIDLKGQTDVLKIIDKSFDKQANLADKLQQHRSDENVLSVKELKNLQKKVEAEKEILKEARDRAKVEIDALEKKGKLNAQEQTRLDELNARYKEANSALQGQVKYTQELVDLTAQEVKNEERVQKSLGFTGSILGGITSTFEKIGIQSKFFEDINKDLRNAAKEAGSTKWSVLGAGLTSIGKGLGAALADPIVQLTLVYKLFKGLFDLGVSYNKEVAETGKQYGLNAQGAKALVGYQQMLVAGSHDEYATRKEVAKAMGEINDGNCH